MTCKECPLFKRDGPRAGNFDPTEGDCFKDPRKERRDMNDPGCSYGITLVKHGKKPNLVE